MTKPTIEQAEHAVHDSYAVDEHNEQITVLHTYGQDPDGRPEIGFKQWLIVTVCALSIMQNVFSGITAGSNQFAIVGALGQPELRTWLVQGAGIPGIAVGPILGIMTDIYGRRKILLCCWALQIVSAIVGMTAHTTTQVLIAQLIAGFANGLSGVMYSVVSELVPSYYRVAFQTVINVAASCSAVIALIGVGKTVLDDPVNGWRWQFYILLMFDVLVFFGLAFFYFPPTRTLAGRKSFTEQVKSNDWIGYTLLVFGVVPFVAGFTWSSTYPWSNVRSWLPVVIGGVFLILCALYEWKGTSHGFLDHRLFRTGRNFPIILFLLAVEGSLFYLINNIYTQQVSTLFNDNTLRTNARFLPYFLVGIPTSILMGWYVTKTKDLKWPLAAGFALFGAAMIGLALSDDRAAVATAFNAVGGIGFTAPLVLGLTMAQLSAPPLFIGTASSLAITCRTLGGVVSLAIAVAIYGSKTTTQTPAAIAQVATSMGVAPENVGKVIEDFLSHNFAGLAQIPGVSGRVIGAIVEASNALAIQGFKVVWFAFLPGAVIATIGSCFLINPKDRINMIVDAPLDVEDVASKNAQDVEGSGSVSEKEESA